MPAIVLVMGKKEGCNKMSKKTHFVTAPFLAISRGSMDRFVGAVPEGGPPLLLGEVARRAGEVKPLSQL